MMSKKSATLSENFNANPLVSVIIPSYNHDRFVADCIQSVLNQSFQDFEIVITDDGSSDKTVDVIRSFTDPRIRLFVHERNQGASIASNRCIANARGKYVAMLSSDDIWYPEKLETQVDFMEQHPEYAVVFGKVEWINEDNQSLTRENFPNFDIFDVENRSRFEWLQHFFKVGNCLCHPCSLVRKNIYAEVGMLNPALASIPDFDLWIRICLKHDIHIQDKRLIKFRRLSDESNASGSKVPSRIRQRFENKMVLDHFLNLTDEQQFLCTFPEAYQFGALHSEIIPYFLGRMAIDSGHDFAILWGLEKIYNLLQDPRAAEILQQNCSYTYRDFLRDGQKYDPFYVSYLDQNYDRDQQILALTAEVASFRASTSWRVTRPLRVIGSLLKGRK